MGGPVSVRGTGGVSEVVPTGKEKNTSDLGPV